MLLKQLTKITDKNMVEEFKQLTEENELFNRVQNSNIQHICVTMYIMHIYNIYTFSVFKM